MRVGNRVLIQDSNQVRGNWKLQGLPWRWCQSKESGCEIQEPQTRRTSRQVPRQKRLHGNKECQNVTLIRVQFREQVYHGDDINFSKGFFFFFFFFFGGGGGACFADACEISCVYTHYIPYARAWLNPSFNVQKTYFSVNWSCDWFEDITTCNLQEWIRWNIRGCSIHTTWYFSRNFELMFAALFYLCVLVKTFCTFTLGFVMRLWEQWYWTQ